MKKILSFVLVLTLLFGLSVFAASAEQSTDYVCLTTKDDPPGAVTYGFKNSEYWENVYVYATGGRSAQGGNFMTYPGVKLEREYVDGHGYLYTFSFATGYYETLIFNDGTTNNYRADLEKQFYSYCLEKLGEESLYEGARVKITDTLKTYDGLVLFTATSWVEPENTECNEIIDYYCVHRSATYSPYGLGVYVSSDDEIYTLEEAIRQDVLRGIYGDTGFKGFEFHRISEDTDIELMHKCLYAFGERYGYSPEEGEGIYCKPYGYVGDYALFYAYYDHYAYPDIIAQEQIGDYYFISGMPCGIGKNNSVAIYALSPEGEVFTLYEAYTKGLVTDLEAVVKLTGGRSIYGSFGKRILELVGIDFNDEGWQHLYRQILPSMHKADDEIPDFVTAFAAESTVDEAPCVKRIGKYAVISDKTYAPYDLGYFVYVPKEDKAYNLEQALKAYPEHTEKLLRMLDYPNSGHYCLIGDVDENRQINIKDATRIQKHIAGMDVYEKYNYGLKLEASDFNGDGKVNVRDATAIQKFIAKLDY